MDVTKTQDAAAQLLQSGRDRSAGLEAARRKASEAQLADASRSKALQAEKIAAFREIIAETLGVNTRIAISRSQAGFDFVYQAIDRRSGEVVQEWPPERVAQIIAERGQSAGQTPPGLIIDGEA